MLIEDLIKNEIKKHGFISLSQFINIALYHSEHGYYVKKQPLGKSGDFTTAPEISQLFGEVVGAYLANFTIENYANHKKIYLVEIGAGRGTLMQDVLKVFSKIPNLLEKLDIIIVDVNEQLIELQKQTLKNHPNIIWKNKIPDNLNNQPVVIFANEFFDCLPIEQLIYKSNSWQQVVVKLDENDKFETSFIQNDILAKVNIPAEVQAPKQGDVYEFSNAVEIEFKKICEILKSNKGIFLTFDYGYFEPQFKSSLQSLKAHKFNDIFDNIGSADLTSYVNFKLLEQNAKKNNLNNIYYSTQAEFLINNGIKIRASKLSENKNQNIQKQIYSGLERLINPEQMGQIFKTFSVINN